MLTLKYPATCAETGKEMKAGEKALYYPNSNKGKNMYHPDSEQATQWRGWQADLAMGNDY